MKENTETHVKADSKRSAKDIQLAALLACFSIVTGFSIYWWGQIQSMLELLEMAYG